MIIRAHQCRNIAHPFPVVAWLIMIFQGMMPWKKDSVSHVVMSTIDGGVVTFYEMNFGGLKVTPEAELLKTYRLVDTHTFKEEDSEEDFARWFLSHQGKTYDFFQLIGLLLKFIGITRLNRIGDDLNKLVCSELALDYASKRYNLDITNTDNYDMIHTWKLITKY